MCISVKYVSHKIGEFIENLAMISLTQRIPYQMVPYLKSHVLHIKDTHVILI